MGSAVERSSAGRAEERTAQHAPLVHHVVTETISRVPSSVTREELTATGMAALAAASRDHEPGADGDFGRYAAARVRAALVDILQAIDWQARGRQHATTDPARLGPVCDAVATLPADRRAVIEGYSCTSDRSPSWRPTSSWTSTRSLGCGRTRCARCAVPSPRCSRASLGSTGRPAARAPARRGS